ncbi:hypothetical protein BXT84_10130 [Sulfobacillus thermotolerans]|uniref:Uncharacterized protein n=1 Tax=Sulfobacillus thermotolerans TaxID=338644 RepID=A0ABN5H2D5_9FIRM|nr:hypothetical protein BXT84_10130 [Sulfobacillus thermotolerans]
MSLLVLFKKESGPSNTVMTVYLLESLKHEKNLSSGSVKNWADVRRSRKIWSADIFNKSPIDNWTLSIKFQSKEKSSQNRQRQSDFCQG